MELIKLYISNYVEIKDEFEDQVIFCTIYIIYIVRTSTPVQKTEEECKLDGR